MPRVRMGSQSSRPSNLRWVILARRNGPPSGVCADHYVVYTVIGKKLHYTKPPEVDRAWPTMARLRIAVRPFLARLVFSNEKACTLLTPARHKLALSLSRSRSVTRLHVYLCSSTPLLF